MKAITIRGIPADLARVIQERADATGSSLSQAILSLAAEAAGLARPRAARPRHSDLDHLIGSWSAARAREFDEALAEQRIVDEDAWK